MSQPYRTYSLPPEAQGGPGPAERRAANRPQPPLSRDEDFPPALLELMQQGNGGGPQAPVGNYPPPTPQGNGVGLPAAPQRPQAAPARPMPPAPNVADAFDADAAAKYDSANKAMLANPANRRDPSMVERIRNLFDQLMGTAPQPVTQPLPDGAVPMGQPRTTPYRGGPPPMPNMNAEGRNVLSGPGVANPVPQLPPGQLQQLLQDPEFLHQLRMGVKS